MRRILVAALCFAGTTAWGAEEADSIKAALSYDFEHDSNLFRLADDVDPVIDGEARDREESIHTGRLVATGIKYLGLQRFDVQVDVQAHRYADYDYLDYTAKNYRGNWDWMIGRRLQGKLGLTQYQAGRSFADFVATTQSINTSRTRYGSLDWRFNPTVRFGAGFSQLESRYRDLISKIDDFDEDTWDAHVTLASASGNELSLVIRNAEGSYLNHQVSLIADTSYRQRDLRVEGAFQASGKSFLNGYIGVARRTYPIVKSRDYSGPIAKLAYEWHATPTIDLTVTVRKEVGAREDLTDTFVVTQALRGDLVLQTTPRLRLQLSAEGQERDYGGDAGLGVPRRTTGTDEQLVVGAGLFYEPNRHFEIGVSLDHDRRINGPDSSQFQNYAARFVATLHY